MSVETRRKELAKKGELYLEEAITDVLFEALRNKECIGPAEISKRAGIFRKPGGGDGKKTIKAMHDAIVAGMLIKLQQEGKVERCSQSNGKGGWKLTDKHFKNLSDGVGFNIHEG